MVSLVEVTPCGKQLFLFQSNARKLLSSHTLKPLDLRGRGFYRASSVFRTTIQAEFRPV